MLMQLGPFQFKLLAPSPQELRRIFDYRWVPVERVGRRPAMQFLGPGEEGVHIRVLMYPHVTGGMGDLERMRNAGQQGTPYRLVSGAGYNFGLWCIVLVEDEQTFFDKKGSPHRVEFNLGLAAYGGDGMGAGAFGGLGYSASSSFGPVSVGGSVGLGGASLSIGF